MSKDTFYFSHDYNVRNDEKIKRLIRKHGYLGYGLFWAIVEDLYNNANALRFDCDGIAFELRVDSELIKSILLDFDLFVFDNDTFGSLSVERRIEERNAKSIKARESAIKRWNNANAMRTQCDGNAIKERKGKEIKEIKEYKDKDFKNVTSWNNCQLYEYSELNEELKKMYDEDTWNTWKVFNKHLDENFEHIREIESQMKIHDYVKLRNEYIIPNKISKNKFIELLSAFNNYKPAKEKYNSVTPALMSWLKKELK